jgi:hypothetical protein
MIIWYAILRNVFKNYLFFNAGLSSGNEHGRGGQRDGGVDPAADRHPQAEGPGDWNRTGSVQTRPGKDIEMSG